MSQWLRPSARWAIYLRDGLKCLYCGVPLAELVAERGGNFLTVDHLRPRCRGGKADPYNLMASCYECNQAKGVASVTQFCRDFSHNHNTVKSRIERRRGKDLAQFREAAKVLLGQVPGIPGVRAADIVIDHDWLVKQQWGDSIDATYWAHLKSQEHLFCTECGSPRDSKQRDYIPEAPWAGGSRDRPASRYDWSDDCEYRPF